MEIVQIEGIGAEMKAIDAGTPLWDKQQIKLALILRCRWDGAVGKGLVSKLLLPFLCERHENNNLFDDNDKHFRNTLVEITLDHWHCAKHRIQWHEKHYWIHQVLQYETVRHLYAKNLRCHSVTAI
jgi:hypothetical protein